MARVNETVRVDGQRWALIHAFADDPGRWLPLPAVPTDDGRWSSTVHGGPVLQSVRVRIGEARDLPDAFTRHVSWVPVAHGAVATARVLPVLEGQLRIEHRHPPGVSLVLTAHYRPPGGRAGDLIDVVAIAPCRRRDGPALPRGGRATSAARSAHLRLTWRHEPRPGGPCRG